MSFDIFDLNLLVYNPAGYYTDIGN